MRGRRGFFQSLAHANSGAADNSEGRGNQDFNSMTDSMFMSGPSSPNG